MTAQPASSTTEAVVRVGPSGWSYPDWSGIVYPPGASRKFDQLGHIARYFDTVEVNVSFYRLLTRPMTESWLRRTAKNDAFRFTVKLWQRFTHELDDYTQADVDAYLEPLRPMADAGRLGCILLQFPWSFRRSPQSVERLRRLSDQLADHPRAVELRHASWDVPETLADLREMGIGYCNIDQPALRACIGPTAHATAAVGYVRFHGRRTDTWFAQNTSAAARYDYLYSQAELEEWVPRIGDVAARCEEVYVFANNHFRGQGPANALQLRALLEGGPVAVPDDLAACFPDLANIRKPDANGVSDSLF